MTITPPGPRFAVETTLDGTRVVIPARRNWFLVLFLGFWLCGWLLGEVTAATMLLSVFTSGSGEIPSVFLLVWLGGWTVGGGFALFMWLWNLMGKEVIALERGELTVTRRVGPIGFPKRYDLAHVRNARVGPAPIRRSRRRYPGSSASGFNAAIAFDYGARTFHFGTDLDEAEAHYLLDLLHPRLPRADKGYAAPPF